VGSARITSPNSADATAPKGLTEASALVVATKTYDSQEAAEADLAFTRRLGGGAPLPTKLGEESMLASVFVDRSVEFRSGLRSSSPDGAPRRLRAAGPPAPEAAPAVDGGLSALALRCCRTSELCLRETEDPSR